MSNNRYANIINPNLPSDSPTSTVTNPMTTNLSMGGNKIVSVGTAVALDSVPSLGQVQSLIGSGTWVGTATSYLNMQGNYIYQADYVDFVNQDLDGSGTPLTIQARTINSKPVMTIQTRDATQEGIIYDSVFNQPPSGGGGWVGWGRDGCGGSLILSCRP